MKIKFFLIVLLSALVVSCSGQELNISVENNSKDYHAPQVFYWVNNTGAEIKNAVNDYILTSSKIHAVRFKSLDIKSLNHLLRYC